MNSLLPRASPSRTTLPRSFAVWSPQPGRVHLHHSARSKADAIAGHRRQRDKHQRLIGRQSHRGSPGVDSDDHRGWNPRDYLQPRERIREEQHPLQSGRAWRCRYPSSQEQPNGPPEDFFTDGHDLRSEGQSTRVQPVSAVCFVTIRQPIIISSTTMDITADGRVASLITAVSGLTGILDFTILFPTNVQLSNGRQWNHHGPQRSQL
jgi:hypothetical protein